MFAIPPSAADRRAFLGGLLIAVLGSILFSAKAIVAKLMYRYQVDAVMVLTLRMMFSLPVFVVIAMWKQRTEPRLAGADYLRICLLGLIGYYLSSFLDFLGLQYISAGLERLILFLTPTFVLLMSFFFYRRAISGFEWWALLLSYAGTVCVFLHDVSVGGPHVGLGSFLVLGAALSYAVYLLLSGQLVRRVGALRLVAYAMCVSSVVCIVQFFILRPAAQLVQPMAVYQLSIFNAIFCTVLPVCLTMVAVVRIGASSVAQASMIGPVSTLFMGALVLGEPITAIQVGGMALVLSGIYLLSKKKV